jgi:PncC family amidohydrolase
LTENTLPEDALEVQVGVWLRRRDLKLVTAESCTGGLIAHRLTNVPGSSEYYLGGAVAYAYEAKEQFLGVSHETLTRYGAVSQETVIEMARGARHVMLDAFPMEKLVGLSVSGIAGPGGGMPGKPVGLVWVGLSAPNREQAWKFIWPGDRLMNKELSAEKALELLLEYLVGDEKEKTMRHTLEEIDVRWTGAGEILPRQFTWNGQKIPVESVGRQWKDENGAHVLVMALGGQAFELTYTPQAVWTIRPISGGQAA